MVDVIGEARLELVDLRKLDVFVKIVEAGSLTRAAAQLSVAQSALSRKVRELEEQLGTALVYRNGRGVVLTETGQHFFERAKMLLRDSEAIITDIKNMTAAGSVTIGIPPSVTEIILPRLLAQARLDFPDVRIKIVETFSGYVQEWLLSGRIDIGVLYETRRMPTLLGDELVVEEMYVVGPSGGPLPTGRPIALAELTELPFVLPSRPHGLRVLIDDACAKAKVNLNVVVEINGLGTVKNLIRAGNVHAILPYSAIFNEVSAGLITASPIVAPAISRRLRLATSNERPPSRAAREVAHLIRTQVNDLVRNGFWHGHGSSAPTA
jgi:LysR family nitrogen assimilation transcriptional regulator